MLEAATNKLMELGSHHGWFKFSNLDSLDPIGREEMLDLVSQVVQEYVNELTMKQESIHDLEQLVTDIEEDRQKFLLRAEVAEQKAQNKEAENETLAHNLHREFVRSVTAEAEVKRLNEAVEHWMRHATEWGNKYCEASRQRAEAAEALRECNGTEWCINNFIEMTQQRNAALARAEAAEVEVKRLETRVAKLKHDEQINFDGMLEADAKAEAAERQRDEAFTAGAAAMQEVCAKTVWPYVRGLDDIIRALPIPAQEVNDE